MTIFLHISELPAEGEILGPLWRPQMNLPQPGESVVIWVTKTGKKVNGQVIRVDSDQRVYQVRVADKEST